MRPASGSRLAARRWASCLCGSGRQRLVRARDSAGTHTRAHARRRICSCTLNCTCVCCPCADVLKQQGHYFDLNAVAYSPNGQLMATGGDDGKVKVWNASTGFCFVTFHEHTAPVTALTFIGTFLDHVHMCVRARACASGLFLCVLVREPRSCCARARARMCARTRRACRRQGRSRLGSTLRVAGWHGARLRLGALP
ncbi:hypothetical protein EON67_00710 [archaeon]|nr:MAG: hypothetical protein EON67_00710 [archaeon]